MNQPHADRPSVPHPPADRPEQARPFDNPRSRQLPRCKVVLQQNAVDDLMFVVRSVMELMRFPRAEATYKMWEAYHSGRSVLLTTYRERAELYVEQFASKGLTVTVEPV
jgi:ATP-dependent Clp protease adapter protein ClpS